MTSSHGYAKPLVCEPGQSRALLTLSTATYGAGAIALFWLPPLWAVAAAVVLAAGGMFDWRRRSRQPPRLEWHPDGSWSIATPAHHGTTAWLAVGTFCSPWLVVLTLADERRVYRWVLARDAVDTAVWRRLRMRLRQYPTAALVTVGIVRGLG